MRSFKAAAAARLEEAGVGFLFLSPKVLGEILGVNITVGNNQKISTSISAVEVRLKQNKPFNVYQSKIRYIIYF